MKRLAIAIAAAMMMSSAAMAQDNKKLDGKRPSKTEMAQRHTDRMVKEYGLNSKQAKKLLTLNTEYADKMRPMGGHHGRPHGKPGEMKKPDGQITDGQNPPQKPEGDKKPGGDKRPDGQKGPGGKKPSEAELKQMKANRDAYNAELKKIMTADQYAKYQADEQKRKRK